MKRHDPTDDELLASARAGDANAFRQLVERYEDSVAAVAISMLGPGSEAEDVGQETFVRFYRAMDRFRGEASLRTYLARIATNLSLNALRSRRRQADRFQSRDAADAELPELTGDARREMEARDRAEQVRAAIGRLDADRRAVVTLRMMEGYSTRETAEMLGIPAGTVMSRLSRAMDSLQEELRPWMENR